AVHVKQVIARLVERREAPAAGAAAQEAVEQRLPGRGVQPGGARHYPVEVEDRGLQAHAALAAGSAPRMRNGAPMPRAASVMAIDALASLCDFTSARIASTVSGTTIA